MLPVAYLHVAYLFATCCLYDHELIATLGVDSFEGGESSVKGVLHEVHGAADVGELMMQTKIHLQQLTNLLPIVRMKLYSPSESCGSVYHLALKSPFEVYSHI